MKQGGDRLTTQKIEQIFSRISHGVIFFNFQAPMLGGGGAKNCPKNIILIILDTRLIWKSNLNLILMKRGGQK